MENQICERPEVDEILDLGKVLGQNQAFGLIAGRCSAAHAEGLSRLRNGKQFKRVAEDWDEFCPQHLGMSGSQANRIIQLWEEFGAGYFEVAQLTRVSAETYRLLAPAVENGIMKLDGEQIELTIENSRKVAAAIAQARRAAPPKAAAPAEIPAADRIERLEQMCNALICEFGSIPQDSSEVLGRYKEVVLRLFSALRNIRRTLRY